MAFALLGTIRIGDPVWTGPTAAKKTRKASLPEHEVARGKPVVQDTGDALDVKTLDFFFDETFCDPEAELAQLEIAFEGRSPLSYVGGDGAYDGSRFVVEELEVETLKTTPAGRAVRIKASVKLKEVPTLDMLGLLGALARAAATGLAGVLSLGARR